MPKNIQTLSFGSLRRRCRKEFLQVRHVRNFDRRLGNDGYILIDAFNNIILTMAPTDEAGMRELLIERLG